MRPWSRGKDEPFNEAYVRLCAEDSNAYSMKTRSIAVRIKNAVALSSDIRTDDGSDMFFLSNSLAHKLTKVYGMILTLEISDEAKEKLMNRVKEIESAPSEFAAALTQARKERKDKEREE